MFVGGRGQDGDIFVYPATAQNNRDPASAAIHLSGDSGDIILRNADCAEDFDLGEPQVEPGSVLVLDDEGRLRLSDRPYDRRVAGVASGAGPYGPALVLDRQPNSRQRAPVALVGKVMCFVDANYGPICVGDLLTTSATRGCAMVAKEPQAAFGSVLGKALAPMLHGKGLIPILVALQ